MKNVAASILRFQTLPSCHLRYPPPSVMAEVGAWAADTVFFSFVPVSTCCGFVSDNKDEPTTSVSPSRSCTATVQGRTAARLWRLTSIYSLVFGLLQNSELLPFVALKGSLMDG